ncbi:MAG: transglycosylase domain-containing protein [Chloroflexi bacterium]|nr:transglycosylase domain-containing protein [Chloroflexota bacterium]
MTRPSRRRIRWRRIAAAASVALIIAVVGVWAWLTHDLPPIERLQTGLALPSTRIFDRNGQLLYEILPPEQGRNTPIAYDDIPDHCVNAIVATEDANFWSHPGVDPAGILRALWINLRGGDVVAGGSTITQQVARLTMLNPGRLPERTLKRKLQEMLLAVQLETAYSKEDVLALYANQAYFGSLAYGLEAAARAYFAKPAGELSLAECALVAGLLQGPAIYDPLQYPEAAKERQLVVLRLMVEHGAIDTDQAERAGQDALQYAAVPFPIEAPHAVMRVWAELAQRFPEQLYRDGLDVTTTIDLDWQREAERIARERLAQLNRADNPARPPANVDGAALVALDPRTGEVRVMLGSPDYFDDTRDGAVNAATALRQPGSALKPFTYAAAFDPGRSDPWTAASMVLDVETAFYTRKNELYVPANFGFVEHGPVSIREALASSYNIPAVAVLDDIGTSGMIELAARAGLTALAENPDLDLAVTLGGGEVRLLDLTAAYGVFANGGYAVEPVLITSVVQRGGPTLYEWTPPEAPEPVLDSRVAWLITDILADPTAREPGFGPNSPLNIGRPAAAKTGTTTDFRDNWVVGYTPSLVVGVWVGNPDNRPMREATGLTGAGPIWHSFIRSVLLGTPEEQFDPPPPGMSRVAVCVVSGMLPTDNCPGTRLEWFIDGTEPSDPDTLWVTLPTDPRTGEIATGSTAEANRVRAHYMVLPERATAWAREAGVAALTPEMLERVRSVTTMPDSSVPVVFAPHDGAVYQLSRSIPVATQRLSLEASVPVGTRQVDFVLNGEVVGSADSAPWRVFWTLAPGDYDLSAVAIDGAGRQVESAPVTFTVLIPP